MKKDYRVEINLKLVICSPPSKTNRTPTSVANCTRSLILLGSRGSSPTPLANAGTAGAIVKAPPPTEARRWEDDVASSSGNSAKEINIRLVISPDSVPGTRQGSRVHRASMRFARARDRA